MDFVGVGCDLHALVPLAYEFLAFLFEHGLVYLLAALQTHLVVHEDVLKIVEWLHLAPEQTLLINPGLGLEVKEVELILFERSVELKVERFDERGVALLDYLVVDQVGVKQKNLEVLEGLEAQRLVIESQKFDQDLNQTYHLLVAQFQQVGLLYAVAEFEVAHKNVDDAQNLGEETLLQFGALLFFGANLADLRAQGGELNEALLE